MIDVNREHRDAAGRTGDCAPAVGEYYGMLLDDRLALNHRPAGDGWGRVPTRPKRVPVMSDLSGARPGRTNVGMSPIDLSPSAFATLWSTGGLSALRP